MSANLEDSAVATYWKRSVLIPIPKQGSTKGCSNHQTIELVSHASMTLLKILQTRLQPYMNGKLQMFRQMGLEKAEELEIKSPTFSGS